MEQLAYTSTLSSLETLMVHFPKVLYAAEKSTLTHTHGGTPYQQRFTSSPALHAILLSRPQVPERQEEATRDPCSTGIGE